MRPLIPNSCDQVLGPRDLRFILHCIFKCDWQFVVTGNSVPWYQNSWGQYGAHLGTIRPRWAQCWPHELCYLGCWPGQTVERTAHTQQASCLYSSSTLSIPLTYCIAAVAITKVEIRVRRSLDRHIYLMWISRDILINQSVFTINSWIHVAFNDGVVKHTVVKHLII